MDLGSLHLVLQRTLSPKKEDITAAEEQLKQFETVPGYVSSLFQLCVHNDVDIAIKQAGAIYMKNFVNREWHPVNEETSQPSKIHDSEKVFLREHLLEALIHSHPNVRSQFAVCLRSIIDIDYPDNFKNLLPGILNNFNSNEPTRIRGALVALRVLAKRYEYKPENARAPLEEITAQVMPILIALLKHLIAMNNADSAEMMTLVCKVFWSCTQLVMPPYFSKNLANFDAWMDLFLQILMTPVPELPGVAMIENPLWKSRKWIGHILHRLFTRFGNPEYVDKKYVPFAKNFLKKHACNFLNGFLNLLVLRSKGGQVPDMVTTLSLNYVNTSINHSDTYKILKKNMPVLLQELIFPHLCFDDKDAEMWNDDPHEYVRKSFDIIEEFYSPKTAAVNLLFDLAGVRAKDTLAPFLGFATRVLNEYLSSPPQSRNARAKDGALYAIGSLKRKLQKKPEYAGALEQMLVAHVFPEFTNANGFLRARACWIVGEFADIDYKSTDNFLFALRSVITCLRDSELPVRVQAGLSLKHLLEADIAANEIKPILPTLLEEYFKLMDEIENDELVGSLEVIIDRFGPDMAPFATVLMSKLVHSFSEMFGNTNDEDEESALAAMGCLRAMITLLQSVNALPDLYVPLEQILIPMLTKLLTPEGLEYLEEAIDIISYLTFFQKSVSPQLWSLFPLLYKAFNEFAYDYIGNMLAPLDNYISRDPEGFLRGTPECNYLDCIYKMCSKVLTSETAAEADCQPCAQLLSVVLHNCRGRVDNYVAPYLDLVVNRLQTAEGLALKILLLDVIADALYYNPKLTLDIFESKGWTMEVFKYWFNTLKDYKRVHDKKFAVLGLCAVLGLEASGVPLPAVVSAGLPQITCAVLNLLAQLQKQKEEAANKSEEEDEDFLEDDVSDDELEDTDDDNNNANHAYEDDEDIIEDDGADDREFSEADEKYFKNLVAEARANGWDEIEGDELDEDEEYFSVLDQVDENLYFAEVIHSLSERNQPSFAKATASLDADQQNALRQLIQVYLQKRAEQQQQQQQQ